MLLFYARNKGFVGRNCVLKAVVVVGYNLVGLHATKLPVNVFFVANKVKGTEAFEAKFEAALAKHAVE